MPAMSDMLATEATLDTVDTVGRPSLLTCPTATLPPATTSLTPLVLATSLRGRLRLILTTDTATDTDTPAPSPPEFPPSLMLDSPSRATLRATATATMAMVTNHHICSGLTRL